MEFINLYAEHLFLVTIKLEWLQSVFSLLDNQQLGASKNFKHIKLDDRCHSLGEKITFCIICAVKNKCYLKMNSVFRKIKIQLA